MQQNIRSNKLILSVFMIFFLVLRTQSTGLQVTRELSKDHDDQATTVTKKKNKSQNI